jgi:hypothetical protein
MNRVEQMETIQSQALELFKIKNADYGDAFAKYGVIGVLHHFALKTPKWQRYLHSFTPTKWAF